MTQYRKLIAALVGAAAEAVALGYLDAKALAIAVAFLTALGVYAVPNDASVDVAARVAPYDRGQSAVNVLLIVLLVIVILVVLGII